METKFLPAERASEEEIREKRNLILALPLIKLIVNGIPDGAVILNSQRQIIVSNRALLEARGLDSEEAALGLRPGEAFGCIHANNPLGCGTTEFCRYCGAAKVLNSCRMGKKAADECRIISEFKDETEAFDLLVWGTPFRYGGDDFIFFTIYDITHEKRRQVLERIFFHDALNTAGGLLGFAELLAEEAPPELDNLTEPILFGARTLVEEITSHKDLNDAETGELGVEAGRLSSGEVLKNLQINFGRLGGFRQVNLDLDPDIEEFEFESDPVLVNRSLGNLVKNALESSQPGETVTLGCQADGLTVEFWVHNPAVMPPEVQFEIFKRSFSTKGRGRGLGLYGVKLLVARYLRGAVSFTSTPETGTVFRIRLPLNIPLGSNRC